MSLKANPELEIGRYLTEEAGFPHIAPLAGALEYQRPRGEPVTMAVVQGFVPNEGDAWRYTVDQVEHYLEEALMHKSAEGGGLGSRGSLRPDREDPPAVVRELAGGYLEVAAGSGCAWRRCTSRSGDTENPDFTPEPLGLLYQRSRYQSLRNLVGQVFRTLRERQPTLPGELGQDIEQLLRSEARVLEDAVGSSAGGSAGCASGATVTSTSARSYAPVTTSSSPTSKVSQPGRSRNGG